MITYKRNDLRRMAAKYQDTDPEVSKALYEYTYLIREVQTTCAGLEARHVPIPYHGQLLLSAHDYGCWWFQCEERATHVVRDANDGEHHYLCDEHWDSVGRKDAINPRDYDKK